MGRGVITPEKVKSSGSPQSHTQAWAWVGIQSNSHPRVGGAAQWQSSCLEQAQGYTLSTAKIEKEVLPRGKWLEMARSSGEGQGTRQTCSDVEANWVEYEGLSDPGIYLCQKELCTSEDSVGREVLGVSWQVVWKGNPKTPRQVSDRIRHRPWVCCGVGWMTNPSKQKEGAEAVGQGIPKPSVSCRTGS